MKRGLILAGLILGLGCGLRAQIVDTTVCDVVKKPASFDGKMVRIKGTVFVGFDEFAIKDSTDPNCGFPVNAIWLSYPQGTKGKAGPLAFVQLQPAHNFAGKFAPPTRAAVTLDKSKDFKQFDSLLAQSHQKGADMCLGCARYEVTATLVGRLDSVDDPMLKRDAGGKIVGFGGFGNMNAYPARLVLQSVADVTPKEIDYSKTDLASKGDAPMEMPGGGNDFSMAVAMAQKIAGVVAPGPSKDAMVKAVAVYPKPNEKNGVTAGFGLTNEATASGDAQGSKDSPDGVLLNCTFNQDRLQGMALALAAIHMGQHMAELRDPGTGNADAPAYFLESNAWVVTTVAAVTSGQKFLTLSGGYQVWNITWTADERNGKMQSSLKDFLNNGADLSQ